MDKRRGLFPRITHSQKFMLKIDVDIVTLIEYMRAISPIGKKQYIMVHRDSGR